MKTELLRTALDAIQIQLAEANPPEVEKLLLAAVVQIQAARRIMAIDQQPNPNQPPK
jgi:hypothetical protein